MSTRLFVIHVMVFGMLSACGSSPSLPEQSVQLEVSSIPSKGIDWDEAKSYVGEYKVVCGPVVDTAYASGSSGKPTFLNLGRSYPDPERFTVVIWDGNRANFPAQPDNYYLGKNICVDGLIELYKGGAQIEGTTSDQIDIH